MKRLDPDSRFILRAVSIGAGALALVAGLSQFQATETNQWAVVPDDRPAITVAQVLTDEELLGLAQWVVDNAKPEVLEMIKRTQGYAIDETDLAALGAETVRGMFRDFEWAGRRYFRHIDLGVGEVSMWRGGGPACLWCLNKRQGPESAPHYRAHVPGCPVDMVCSKSIKCQPIGMTQARQTILLPGEEPGTFIEVEAIPVQFPLQVSPLGPGFTPGDDGESWEIDPEWTPPVDGE